MIVPTVEGEELITTKSALPHASEAAGSSPEAAIISYTTPEPAVYARSPEPVIDANPKPAVDTSPEPAVDTSSKPAIDTGLEPVRHLPTQLMDVP